MDVFEAVRTIVAVRQYRDDPVPADVLRRIVEAGRLSASAMNRQPWHFVVVENRATLRRLGAAAPTAPYIAGAGAAVVVAMEEGATAVSDVSRAIQSMLLTAWSEGIGSNWGGFFGLEDVNAIVSVPAGMQVIGVLPLGYPAKPARVGRKARKPLPEVASRERYGVPFE
jgi:nitroreductase